MQENYLNDNTLGWGEKLGGSEIWDDNPIFLGDGIKRKDWMKLIFYPKKFFLYRYLKKNFDQEIKKRSLAEPYRILDVGCGTGATVVDLKKIFGRRSDIVGIDVVRMQIDLAKEKIRKNAVAAEACWYNGYSFPFGDNIFDAVYTSDVLGHVENVELWLGEIARVLKPGGVLAMFSESELGKHALVRKYLLKRGLNVDPHAESHISLYSKAKLKEFIQDAGFDIKSMYGLFWASFFVHPDEFYEKLQQPSASFKKNFFFLKNINKLLYKFKKKTHPYSTALSELYGLVEALFIGRWVESQGYVILGKKKQ